MRLCQIVPSLEERHGGPSKSVRELSAALASLGHEVDLLATSPDGGGARAMGNLTVRAFRRTGPGALCSSEPMRSELRGMRSDAIHHHALWLSTLGYARAAAARLDVPLVISPRGMMSAWAWKHHRLKKWLASKVAHPGAFRAAAGWHATSEEEAADIRARGFRQPICVAPNGIALPSDEARAEAARYWLELCPEAADRPVALFYSRFHRKKRVLELIDLWLEQAPRDWLLLMVGIPQEYTAEALDDYVLRSLGSGRIRVYSGLGRPPPYAVASLFVLPSHSENFGLAIAEALASGVPALVTDGTPWRQLNAAGAGWCVPWENYGAALRAAAAEGAPALRARGIGARTWVGREYSWEKPARALAEFYTTLRSVRTL